jgi:hypothetical protein
MRPRWFARSFAPALALSLAAAPGCVFAVNTILKTTVNMEKWDVSKVTLQLRGGDRICPRAPIQLGVLADARHVKRDKQKRHETWVGPARKASRIGKMAFTEFDFTVDGGTVDPESGWFTPNRDVLATVGGFNLAAKYKRQAEIPAATLAVAPTYACITSAGAAGAPGSFGQPGATGGRGDSGASGGSDASGGAGGDGTAGGLGGDGGPGGAGGTIAAWAMLVRTPHHDRLVLLAYEGDASDIVLVDPAVGFVLSATGGSGGPGGQGGSGGDGGSGGSGGTGGAGGTGGHGGNGGNGGHGGPGGRITLVVDEAHPEIAEMIRLDVSGGYGGLPGGAGSGGSGGSGGAASAEGASKGTDGTSGTAGQQGARGGDGAAGTVAIEAGDLSARFPNLPPGVERI